MHIPTDKTVHTDKGISGWEFIVLVVCGLVTKKKKSFITHTLTSLYKTVSTAHAIKAPLEISTSITVTIKVYKIRLILEVSWLDWVSQETEALCSNCPSLR